MTNPLLEEAKRPFISLCVICGDEGVETLGRMLRSVIDRPGGSMVNEIVIGWNGTRHEAFTAALAPWRMVGAAAWSEPEEEVQWYFPLHSGGVSFISFKQEWRDDFAAARQETFDRASGTWRMYLDTDDIVPRADIEDERKAMDAALKRIGVDPAQLGAAGGAPKTLGDYLEALALATNAVALPYDYQIGGDGQALEWHMRRRIYRWGDGWVWQARLLYHEDVAPTGGCVPNIVENHGLPIRHYATRPVAERTARNRAILGTMMREVEQGVRPPDATIYYNSATFALEDGDWNRAVSLLTQALALTQDETHSMLYAKLRCRALLLSGRAEPALLDALRLIGRDPAHRTGLDLAIEVVHHLGWWKLVVDFYELAIKLPVRGDIGDHPVERESHLRIAVADALAKLGRTDEALTKAREALAVAPQDATAKDAVKRYERLVATRGRFETTMNLATSLVVGGDFEAAHGVMSAMPAEFAFDPRVAALLEVIDRGPQVAPEPLPIFKAPSPWARWVGSKALELGWKRVLVAGAPHPDDLEALRKIVSSVEWVNERPTDKPGECDAVIDVDTAHRELGSHGVPRDASLVVTIPAPEVSDPARRRAPFVAEALDAATAGERLVDLEVLEPTRPDSDFRRLIVRYERRNTTWKGPREIAIYAPHWAEIWTPEAIRDGGCGGSEEAIIYLSAELARRGCDVSVYGPWRPTGGGRVIGGVTWRHISDFNPHTAPDIIIAHRAPWLVRYRDVLTDNRRVLVWHHDHGYPDAGDWNASIAERGEHLWVSSWQRGILAGAVDLSPEALRGCVIGNGVPAEEFRDLRDERIRGRVIYASQPQRGLLQLLKAWPLVLEAEPNAELHFFGGWYTAEFIARSNQPTMWKDLDEIRQLVASTPRVVEHGRIGQAQLSREMQVADVWAYPCVYPEVSCIAGLRAAAAGCKLVFAEVGALLETMSDRTYSIQAHSAINEGVVASRIVEAIRGDEYSREAVSRSTLATSSWSAVVDRLEAYLNGEDGQI